MLPDSSGFEILRMLRERRAKARIVVLSGLTDAHDIERALAMGAAGYIPKACSAGITLGALRLILAGGTYLPPDLLESRSASQRPVPSRVSSGMPRVQPAELGLSERQAQVLALLVRGLSNKAIAQELKLAEQTVKAHMSAAFRALNVANRTQAAIAVSQLGLELPDPKRS
jgi:DNA-binding NarL/FixJ family response regulator